MDHPLAAMLDAVARGGGPPADGLVTVLGPMPDDGAAVLGFTGHHVVIGEVAEAAVLDRLPCGDLSAPLSAPFLTWLAAETGTTAGITDALLCTIGGGGPPPLTLTPVDGLDHARVARAHRYRRDVRILTAGGGDGVLVLGRGLAGRWEVAFEVAPPARGRGLGRALAAAARSVVPVGEVVWAQVSPGNAASLRAVLAAGYVPVGSEVLLRATRG